MNHESWSDQHFLPTFKPGFFFTIKNMYLIQHPYHQDQVLHQKLPLYYTSIAIVMVQVCLGMTEFTLLCNQLQDPS